MSSPTKQTDGRSLYTSSATSKVIDELQSKIDQLGGDLNETKESLREYKQKNSILRKRNDNLVEQLSNAKHESDMSESLLKRKERRVVDLEAQLTEALSKADNLQFELQDMKKKAKMLTEKEEVAVSECERLKVSYDAIVTAQNEYKRLMGNKLSGLEQRLFSFLDDRKKTLDSNMDLLKRQEPEIMASYQVVVKNSERLEEMYAQRQQSVSQALVALAGATKTHGEKTGIVMAECEDVLKQMNRNEELMARLRSTNNDSDTKEDIKESNEESGTHELSFAHREEHDETEYNNHRTMAEERRRSDSNMKYRRISMAAEAGIRGQDEENKENLKKKVFKDSSMDGFEPGRGLERRNSRRRETPENGERISSSGSFNGYDSFDDSYRDPKLILPKQRHSGTRKGNSRTVHGRNRNDNASGNWGRSGYGNGNGNESGSGNGNESGNGGGNYNNNRNSGKGGNNSRRTSSQRRSGRGSRGGHNRGNRRSYVQSVSSRD